MDVARKTDARKRILNRALIAAALLLAAGGATYGVSHLQPALPSVESGTIWPDTVRRGPMLRQVHGIGSLVPEDVLWISAQIDGRIEKISVKPGAAVTPDTVIMELSNPTLTEAMTGAEYDLKQAEAAYTDLDVTLQSLKFDKQAAAAEVASDYQEAKIKADRDKQLADQGLLAPLDFKLSADRSPPARNPQSDRRKAPRDN